MAEALLNDPRSLLMVALVLVVVGLISFSIFVFAAVWLARRVGKRASEDTTVSQRQVVPDRVPLAPETQRSSKARVTPWAPPPVGVLRSIAPIDGRNLHLDDRVATGEPPAEVQPIDPAHDDGGEEGASTELISKEELIRKFSLDKRG